MWKVNREEIKSGSSVYARFVADPVHIDHIVNACLNYLTDQNIFSPMIGSVCVEVIRNSKGIQPKDFDKWYRYDFVFTWYGYIDHEWKVKYVAMNIEEGRFIMKGCYDDPTELRYSGDTFD